VTRWLAWRLAPITRRVLAPEVSLDAYRDELLDSDRGRWLANAKAAWFVAMCLSVLGEFIVLPLVNVSKVADDVCRGFLVLVGACLVPQVTYTLLSGWYDWRGHRTSGLSLNWQG
jgi:hypothetical protein